MSFTSLYNDAIHRYIVHSSYSSYFSCFSGAYVCFVECIYYKSQKNFYLFNFWLNVNNHLHRRRVWDDVNGNFLNEDFQTNKITYEIGYNLS